MFVSYAEAETILARTHGADHEWQIGAFRGRLKNLRKHRIPLGVALSRGKKIAYSEEHMYQWALCFEFMQIGIDPRWFHDILKKNWMVLRTEAFFQASAYRGKEDGDIFIWFIPEFLNQERLVSQGNDGIEELPVLGVSQFPDGSRALEEAIEHARRICFINVSKLVRNIRRHASDVCGPERFGDPESTEADRVAYDVVAAYRGLPARKPRGRRKRVSRPT